MTNYDTPLTTKTDRHAPWNKGKLIGAKPLLRPSHVWSIRTKRPMQKRKRDLALFNLAIDSKLRGCEVVAVRVDDVSPSGYAMDRATVRQKKTGRPVKFELTDQTRQAIDEYLRLCPRKLRPSRLVLPRTLKRGTSLAGMFEDNIDDVALPRGFPNRGSEATRFFEPGRIIRRAHFEHLTHANSIRSCRREQLNRHRAKTTRRAPYKYVVSRTQHVRAMPKQHTVCSGKNERVSGAFFPRRCLGRANNCRSCTRQNWANDSSGVW